MTLRITFNWFSFNEPSELGLGEHYLDFIRNLCKFTELVSILFSLRLSVVAVAVSNQNWLSFCHCENP